MIKRIFLDLDDVLNCCTLDILRYLGCPIGSYDYDKYDPDWGYDVVKAANALHPTEKFTAQSLWDRIERHHWTRMRRSMECGKLMELCEDKVGRKNVCILSSPTLDPYCAAGKIEWICQYLPEWLHRQYLIGPPKHMCANPNALLIDDKYQNIVEFRKAGGLAITLPRPWNLHYDKDPMRHVEAALACIV